MQYYYSAYDECNNNGWLCLRSLIYFHFSMNLMGKNRLCTYTKRLILDRKRWMHENKNTLRSNKSLRYDCLKGVNLIRSINWN